MNKVANCVVIVFAFASIQNAFAYPAWTHPSSSEDKYFDPKICEGTPLAVSELRALIPEGRESVELGNVIYAERNWGSCVSDDLCYSSSSPGSDMIWLRSSQPNSRFSDVAYGRGKLQVRLMNGEAKAVIVWGGWSDFVWNSDSSDDRSLVSFKSNDYQAVGKDALHSPLSSNSSFGHLEGVLTAHCFYVSNGYYKSDFEWRRDRDGNPLLFWRLNQAVMFSEF